MADSLDSLVKGTAPGPVEKAAENVGTSGVAVSLGRLPGDPLSHTPSSPSMIYLNLLILEASLRAQYLELRARRRHHTFFLSLLSVWLVGFGYALFLAPREDGRGKGGSVYWVVDVTEKVCFMGGVITAVLVWATGIWERGVRWPRRWFAVSNRGLRGFNCKLVLIRRPWWAEFLSTVAFFLTYGLFSNAAGSSYRYVEPIVLREVERELDLKSRGHQALPIVSEDEERGGHDEDLAPGGDYVKLLLLAKPFSPTFRENWELYRTEYWERENERRALVRAKVYERDRRLLRATNGWLWWLPWAKTPVAEEKPQHVHREKAHHRRLSVIEKEHRRARSGSARRGSTSGTSTRSPTPFEGEDTGVSRRSSNASEKKKKKPSATAAGPRTKRPGMDSRSVTPDVPSPLARERSMSNASSIGSQRDSSRRGKASSDPA